MAQKKAHPKAVQGMHPTDMLDVLVRKRATARVTITAIAFAVLWASGMYLLDKDAEWGVEP